jgi:LysR family transcriptional activator of dmlA
MQRQEGIIKDLNHLLHFVEAARSGSFTEAATKLRVSVAAVSRSVAILEQEIGARLFNRSTRRLNLTDDGQFFLEHVVDGLDTLSTAKEVLKDHNGKTGGKLSVSLPNAFCKHYMMPHLPDFLAAFPELELDLHVGDYTTDLLAGGFDVVVQHGQPPETGYIRRSLGHFKIMLMASPSYIAKRGVPATVADLSGHECLGMRNALGAAALSWELIRTDAAGAAERFQPAGRCFVNSQLDTAIYAALHGVGITPCDIGAARRHLEDGSLKIVLPNYQFVNDSELCLLYPHRRFLPARVRIFADFLIKVSEIEMRDATFDVDKYAARSRQLSRRALLQA